MYIGILAMSRRAVPALPWMGKPTGKPSDPTGKMPMLRLHARAALAGGAVLGDPAENLARQWSWGLTPTGNWETSAIDGNSQTRTHNNANEILTISGAITPLYDQAGNNVYGPKPADQTKAMHCRYDAWNRLATIYWDDGDTAGTLDANDTLRATYRYDGLNRRVRKVVVGDDANTTTQHMYHNEGLGLRSLGEAGWQIVEVRRAVNGDPAASAAYKQYAWDLRYIDAPVCRWWDADGDGQMEPAAGEMQYFTNDGNFNTTALIDANSGQVVERYLYDPYGRPAFLSANWSPISASAYDNDVLFCGYRHDGAIGLYHVRERYYDPVTGTWKTRDRILYPDGMNLYEYCRSTPVVAVDPVGEVYINGWDLYGKDKGQSEEYIAEQVGSIEKLDAVASGKMEVMISFVTEKEEKDPAKLKWFATMLKQSLEKAGAKEAAEHFAHWIDGSDTPLPVKEETFKGTKSYKDLLRDLEKKCDAGGNQTGTKAANESGTDYKVYVLLGGYTYQWKLGPKKENCCSVHFKVDDKYDFHLGKEAQFKNTKKVTKWGRDIDVTFTVGVPDAVVVNLGKVLGAKDFERVTEWDYTVGGDTHKGGGGSGGGGGGATSPDSGR
jgi:RHS repeat-associated protein